jgi:hypothetical protein
VTDLLNPCTHSAKRVLCDYCLNQLLHKARAEALEAAADKAQFMVRYRFSGAYAETVAQEVADGILALDVGRGHA